MCVYVDTLAANALRWLLHYEDFTNIIKEYCSLVLDYSNYPLENIHVSKTRTTAENVLLKT